MSGHSHFSTIKHKKGLADAQRGKIFSKLAVEITVAAREGTDPAMNTKLRAVIDKARNFNMPTENIERAIGRAAGEGDAARLQEVLLEAYGPGGIAVLIAGITDNKNRTLGDVKQALAKFQGKLVAEGAVRWMFERKGVIAVDLKENPSVAKENLELAAIEAGAEDFSWHDELLDVFVAPELFEEIKTKLAKTFVVQSAAIDWVPKEYVATSAADKATAEQLFEALDEHPDVQEVYSNLGS